MSKDLTVCKVQQVIVEHKATKGILVLKGRTECKAQLATVEPKDT